MIVKFDHLSFIETRNNKEEILLGRGEPTFVEDRLENLKIKGSLMRISQPNHDLIYYEASYPLEFIFYDEVTYQSSIVFKDEIVYGHYNNADYAKAFLEGIFGNSRIRNDKDTIICNMKGVLDKRDYYLVLEKTDELLSPYLDDYGYGVVALISNKPFSVVPKDGICTQTEKLIVDGKEMDICFTKSSSVDMIFEIIRIRS